MNWRQDRVCLDAPSSSFDSTQTEKGSYLDRANSLEAGARLETGVLSAHVFLWDPSTRIARVLEPYSFECYVNL